LEEAEKGLPEKRGGSREQMAVVVRRRGVKTAEAAMDVEVTDE
jgi:hypothetical protein